MRILVLGGSVFCSRAVAETALARGHEVTCLTRGASGSPPAGALHVIGDRDDPATDLRAIVASQEDELEEQFDAVIDVANKPAQVARAVAAWPGAHWVFVSTISVYADHATPGGTPDTLPLLAPITEDLDPLSSPEAYGGMKVACEQAVAAVADSRTIVRPGLIVGPGDPSGRFAYWPSRLADGGEALAPGDPDAPVQVIDVRDLAAWLVDCAEQRRSGVFDAIGRVTTMQAALEEIAEGVGSPARLIWVDAAFLAEHDVRPWSGERSLPLWLPESHTGHLAHDAAPTYAAGLRTRALGDTARDTLAWLRATPDAPVTGLTRAEEAAVLRAWHSLRP